jgi:hypothetical protein
MRRARIAGVPEAASVRSTTAHAAPSACVPPTNASTEAKRRTSYPADSTKRERPSRTEASESTMQTARVMRQLNRHGAQAKSYFGGTVPRR